MFTVSLLANSAHSHCVKDCKILQVQKPIDAQTEVKLKSERYIPTVEYSKFFRVYFAGINARMIHFGENSSTM